MNPHVNEVVQSINNSNNPELDAAKYASEAWVESGRPHDELESVEFQLKTLVDAGAIFDWPEAVNEAVELCEMLTLYEHEISGDVQTLEDWLSDYHSMDPESWHGKGIEDINPAHWIKDGKLHMIESDRGE